MSAPGQREITTSRHCGTILESGLKEMTDGGKCVSVLFAIKTRLMLRIEWCSGSEHNPSVNFPACGS